MSEPALNPFAYHIVRYAPNLIRDEWVNIGVIAYDPAEPRFRIRLIEDESEFSRLRRLHPASDEAALRGLSSLFESTLSDHRGELSAWTAKLEQMLSNTVQFGPQKGLLATDLDSEMDRLYHDQVAAPRPRAAVAGSRSVIRSAATQVFRTTGLLGKLTRSVDVGEFTVPGDPLHLDYAYHRNGTRGFIQSLALTREPAQAKVLAYTADAIRAKIEKTEFVAITEMELRPEENKRHQFISGLFKEKEISLVPLSRLPVWAHQLRPLLQ
ncbi:MAG TPA: DUF3037 domain-containing protein [Candidatus Acidoferrales bacterium]|jgi:hypothetical protein|nr:DUF3037 domain-containing protein [Candidatus Acidoferrales bacterium]